MGELLEINYTYVSRLRLWRLEDATSRMVMPIKLNQVSSIHGVGGGRQLFNNKINDSPNTIYKNLVIIKKFLTKLWRITANECDP